MELDDLKVLRRAANILRELGGEPEDGSIAARVMADAIEEAVMSYQFAGPTPEMDTVPGQVFSLYYSCDTGLHDVAVTIGKSYQYVRTVHADVKRRYPLDEDYLREMFKNLDERFKGEEE